MKNALDTFDQELEAVKVVYSALAPLSETGRQFVVKTVAERLHCMLPASGMPTADNTPGSSIGLKSSPETTASIPSREISSASSVKDFVKSKQPVTEVQRIACLAYFSTHSQKLTEFKTKDLRMLNTDAACPEFSNVSMAVTNAVRQNRFLARGKTGTKRITNIGEAVVMALPDQGAVKEALAQFRKPRKRNQKPTKANTK